MIKAIKIIVFAVLIVAINGFYFEYAVSRDKLPTTLTIIIGVIILAVDICGGVQLIKTIKKLLNI